MLSHQISGCIFPIVSSQLQKYIKHLDGRTLLIERKSGVVTRPDSSYLISGEGFPQHKQIFNKGDLFVEFDVNLAVSVPLTPAALKVRQSGVGVCREC